MYMARRVPAALLFATLLVLAGCVGSPHPPSTATTAANTGSPSVRFHVQNRANRTLTVTIRNVTATPNAIVVNRTLPSHSRIASFDQYFDRGGTYRVELRLRGTTIWNTTIHDYEGLTVTVSDTGEVTVTSAEAA